MDSLHASEKLVQENMNKKVDKRSLVVLRSPWLALLGTLALLPGSQSLPIKGEVHKDVLLPCIVVYKDVFDYNLLVVNWQRPENDTVVHTFYHGSSHPEYQQARYKGRTQIFNESLPNGNASLLLRDLTKSDAGLYICHVVLKQSSGYLTKYVNLTVDDAHVAEIKTPNWIRISSIVVGTVVLALVTLLAWHCIHLLKKGRKDDEERTPLYEKDKDPIEMYKKSLESKMKMNKYKRLYDRQLLVVEGNLSFMCESDNIHFGDQQKSINAKELFITENKHLMLRRMLLVGDVGTGKTYFCKWLEKKWLDDENTPYQCIIYLSGKKVNKKDEKTSVNNILECKANDLSKILQMSGVLLIFDELDDLVYDANTDTDQSQDKHYNLDNNTLLPFNTFIECIINKQLLPETDVLIVSRRDSPIIRLSKHCTSTFVLQEFNGSEANNVYDTSGHLSDDIYKSIKHISYNPAFVLMMCKFDQFVKKEEQLTSPYEVVICLLQQYLDTFSGEVGNAEEQIVLLGKESYENLIKGEQNKMDSQWRYILSFFRIITWTYQCECLRDMLAALYCVWQINMPENLKHCLDFWLFGAHNENEHLCPLLYPVVKRHYTKYYHFIRFFMRLLPYPDYNSLCNKTPNLNENLRTLLKDYFKTNLKDDNQNYKKLAVLHCVFELHDDFVTEALSAIDNFSLLNTPLNSLDIRSIVYCFKKVKLQKLDLRLCALTDKYVKQLKDVIKKIDYVLLLVLDEVPPNFDDDLRTLLKDYFKTNLKDDNQNYKKLAVLHCVFELHNDFVTEALSAIDNFSLLNTPLNSLDIRSIVYCFKKVKLQKLDLRLCALTDKYVKQLKDVIKNIDYVLLSSNSLTSETGIILGDLLQEPNCRIEKLSLGTNKLGPKGAKALWRALEHNKSLKGLYLYDNNIGEDGTNDICEYLEKNSFLQELHLCQNDFNEKAIENIKALKAKKTNLKVVVRISEDLELFEYVEKMVAGLSNTRSNYNQKWLTNLLQIVQADLQKKDWPMDEKLTQERVDNLIKQIETILK